MPELEKRSAWYRSRLSFSWRVDETYMRVKGHPGTVKARLAEGLEQNEGASNAPILQAGDKGLLQILPLGPLGGCLGLAPMLPLLASERLAVIVAFETMSRGSRM